MAKEKKQSNTKTKKIVNAVVIALQVVIVLVAIAFSISILLSTGYQNATDFGDSSIRLMPVLTDSMAGENKDSFYAGDLIIVKKADSDSIAELQKGDIITYAGEVGDEIALITHRIVDIKESTLDDGTVIRSYITKGDAETSGITKTVYEGDIKGIYVSKIPSLGKAIFWLQDSTHFFLVVMLPLILLLVYNAYVVVRVIIELKMKKQKEQAQKELEQAVANAVIDEEEIKRKAIEEYLAKQNSANSAQNNTQEDKKSEKSE